MLAGAWEWSGFLGNPSVAVRVTYVTAVALAIAAMVVWGHDHVRTMLFVACGWWVLAFLWTFVFPTPIPTALRWICGFLVIVPLAFVLPSLLGFGAEYLIFMLLIVWAADIGAYFAGKTFGRIKLAPAISPGKTWEGVIGGFVVVTIVADTGGAVYFRQPAISVVPFCMGVACNIHRRRPDGQHVQAHDRYQGLRHAVSGARRRAGPDRQYRGGCAVLCSRTGYRGEFSGAL